LEKLTDSQVADYKRAEDQNNENKEKMDFFET
jgi:hypothetical protein